MNILRGFLGLACWIGALLCCAAAFYQVRPEAEQLLRSWPNIDQPPQVVANETSPSDRVTVLASPLDGFLAAANGVLPWLILSAALLANATLLGVRNAVDRDG